VLWVDLQQTQPDLLLFLQRIPRLYVLRHFLTQIQSASG
jgi:hypothetical protein